MSTLRWPDANSWRAALAEREQTAWPGPRPLTEDDGPQSLVGREEDLQDFAEAVRRRQLIHFRGESGVGKSSFLIAGAVPAIQRMGKAVLICRSWGLDEERFDQFLARRLRASLSPAEREHYGPTTRSLFETMSSNGDVMVLDQFEELIRHDSKLRRQVFVFLKNLIARTNIRVVLSYRSDSMSLFTDLVPMIDFNVVKTIELKPVAAEKGHEVIRRPRTSKGVNGWEDVITDGAANRIFGVWHDGAQLSPQVGLLHLQALLHVLESDAKYPDGSSDGVINEHHVDDYLARAERAGDARGIVMAGDRIMSFALEEAATSRLALASGIAGELGWDEYLVSAVNRLTAEIVPELSSGGFKVELETSHLAEKVMEDELDHAFGSLPDEVRASVTPSEVIAAVVGALRDESDDTSAPEAQGAGASLSSSRSSLFDEVGEDLEWDVAVMREWVADTDDAQMASGPTLGLSDAAVLVEQVRAFSWAALWLHELNLARLSSTGGGATITLIHDGFGEPLKRWAAGWGAAHPAWVFRGIAAAPGASHNLSQMPVIGPSDVSGKPDRPKMHVNLTLKGNSLLFGHFHHAVFVNCDFRGALFLRCTFEGVTFVNCRLDGALFSDCTISGDVPFEPEDSTIDRDVMRTVETYRFDGLEKDSVPDGGGVVTKVDDHEAVMAIRLYTEGEDDGPLLAAEAGSPARVARSDDHAGAPLLGRSGLVVHGGRLSALTLRGTRFRGGAALVFSRTRGSGVDFAEVPASSDDSQTTRVVVRESVLRHMSVTTSLTDEAASSLPRAAPTVSLSVDNSGITQWWIGAGLRGELDIVNSQCAQIWVDDNGPDGVMATARRSWVKDIDTVTEVDSLGHLGGELDPEGKQLEFFREGTRSTDYRRR